MHFILMFSTDFASPNTVPFQKDKIFWNICFIYINIYILRGFIFYKTHQPISIRQGFTCWITADTAKRYSNANALDYDNNWRISTAKYRTAYIKYILTKIDAKNDRRTWRRLQPRICQTRCCRSELNLPIVMTV